MPSVQFSTYVSRSFFDVSGVIMDGRKLNVISHVSLASRQLRDLAEEVELPLLTYLLGMVILEAEKSMEDGRRSDGILTPREITGLSRN
jgi:hypothetical protein